VVGFFEHYNHIPSGFTKGEEFLSSQATSSVSRKTLFLRVSAVKYTSLALSLFSTISLTLGHITLTVVAVLYSRTVSASGQDDIRCFRLAQLQPADTDKGECAEFLSH
jgi:hypothetical protein